MSDVTRSTVVLVPTIDGRPQAACERGLRGLEAAGVEVRRVSGYAAIDLARSVMATRALADGFEHLVWIDDDIVFEPEDVLRLVASNEPFVAAAYPKKGRRELALHVLPDTHAIVFGEGGGLLEVRYVGTGFLVTHRRVYEAMEPELPICNEQFGERVVPYFLPFVVAEGPHHWYLGEDYAFCERHRRAGGKVLVDTRVRVGHVGSYEYRWEDAGRELERFASFTLALS